MSESQHIKVVDAFDLDDELRTLLKPGEMVRDAQGRRHRLLTHVRILGLAGDFLFVG